MQRVYKPGYATWKFVTKDKVIYKVRNYDALRLYLDYRDLYALTIYVRTKEKGWKLVVSRTPTDKCQCGRYYTDTPNGEPFMYQEYPTEYTIVVLSELMRSPTLCIMCYYRVELKEGRWAPKYVRQQLGLET